MFEISGVPEETAREDLLMKADASEWETKAKDLAERFNKNFVKYTGNEAGKALVAAGPQL